MFKTFNILLLFALILLANNNLMFLLRNNSEAVEDAFKEFTTKEDIAIIFD